MIIPQAGTGSKDLAGVSLRPGALRHAKRGPVKKMRLFGRPIPGVPALDRRIERSAALQGFDQATVHAFLRVRLNEGKPAHENQSYYDKSSYDVLRHGCPSMFLAAARPRMMNAMG